MTTDPLQLIGTLLNGKYRIERIVGEGGFSTVYKAEHTIWHQPVAIKVFRILSNAPPEQRKNLLESFVQEGRLMASLSSRSAAIVQARDIDTFTNAAGEWLPFMVLEWLEGTALDDVLDDERARGLPARPIHECVALLEPAAIAFELAHRQNIAHRDVKPANIFVLGDARGVSPHVKVLDFGIAKVMAEHAEHAVKLAHTGTDVTAFTPNYGAPEQFSRTHGATGPWTDVFAMALVLVEMLRGGLPVLDGTDFMQIGFASRDPSRRPTPRAYGIGVSDAVEQVFARALAVEPRDRFPTMGAFWDALHQAVFPGAGTWSPGTTSGVMSGRGASSIDPSSFTPDPSRSVPRPPGFGPTPPVAEEPRLAKVTTGEPHASSLEPSPRPSKAPIVFGAIGVVALAAAGAGLFFFSRSRVAPVATPPVVAVSAPIASASAAPPKREGCGDDMALVPGGKFFMGTDEKDAALKLANPAHKVTVDSFCIDTYEVTAEAYKACSDVGECKRPEPVPDFPKTKADETDEAHKKLEETYSEFCNFDKPGREKHPINCVSWFEADAYCKWKGKRLPTEAEWEYSARGSDGRKFPWGDQPGDATFMNAAGTELNKWEQKHQLPLSQTMYPADDGFVGTAPVGSFPKGKTKFGAYDFIGNVWEWTSDWFETYQPDEQVNPKGAKAGDRKAIRGGAFNGGYTAWLNPAFRYHMLATATSHGIGFRCASNL